MPKINGQGNVKTKLDPALDPDLPTSRTLQITISQADHVLLARLCTKWTEKGARPSACTKSALISAAIKKLSDVEGIL